MNVAGQFYCISLAIMYIFILLHRSVHIVCKHWMRTNMRADVGNETVNNLFRESLLNEIRFIWLSYVFLFSIVGCFFVNLEQVSFGSLMRSAPNKIIISYMSDVELCVYGPWVRKVLIKIHIDWIQSFVCLFGSSVRSDSFSYDHITSNIQTYRHIFIHYCLRVYQWLKAVEVNAHYDMIVDFVFFFFCNRTFLLHMRESAERKSENESANEIKREWEKSYGTIKPYTSQIIWDWKCNADSINDGIGVCTMQRS